MEHKNLSVMLYSKYSKKCNDFIALLKTPNLGVDLTQLLNLNLICVDNENIRAQIIKSNKIQITEVPCILNIYPDGGVEKYEGVTAFQWITEIINKYQAQVQAQVQAQLQEQVQHQAQLQTQIQAQSAKSHSAKAQSAKSHSGKNAKLELPKETLIEDLISESEEDDIQEENDSDKNDEDDEDTVEPPMAPIRSNSGNYEFSNKFKGKGKKEKKVAPIVVENNTTVKKGNLMAAAMAMQKLREVEDDSKRPPLLK
jgi:hypothetical protein